MEIKEASENGDEATVILQFGRGVIEPPFERIVSLAHLNGAWKIVPDRVEGSAASPKEAVDGFYNWYLTYINSGTEQRNPLADQAYRAAPYLSLQLVRQVDIRAEQNDGFQYDPFLCAQDIPAEMKSVAHFYNDAHPLVLVQSSFEGHYLTVELYRPNFNQWEIRSITCGGSAVGTALALYTWELGYITQSEEMHNPWVDGAYRESPFLAQSFVKNIDDLLASGGGLGADPLLLAQDLPRAIHAEACPEEDCALAYFQYGDVTVQRLQIGMVREGGRLQAATINHSDRPESVQPENAPAGVENWIPYQDEQYGFAMRFPADWIVKGLRVTDHHLPSEYSLMRSVGFFSPKLDGSVRPISLDVVIADSELVMGTYGYGEKLDEVSANGSAYSVYRSDPGIINYIFQHPLRANTWVILTDTVSQFQGREEMAEEVQGIVEAMVSTMVFSK